MDRRRRRRYSESRRPNSMRSLVIAGISGGCILLYGIFMLFAVVDGGNTANILGAVSVLLMLTSIVCLVYGIRDFKDDSFNQTSRIVGLLFSAVSTVFWIGLYIVGMLMG